MDSLAVGDFTQFLPQRGRARTKEESRWRDVQRLVLAPRGLTGLLNPLSIWHKIISAVFHGLFQLCFSRRCWSRSAP